MLGSAGRSPPTVLRRTTAEAVPRRAALPTRQARTFHPDAPVMRASVGRSPPHVGTWLRLERTCATLERRHRRSNARQRSLRSLQLREKLLHACCKLAPVRRSPRHFVVQFESPPLDSCGLQIVGVRAIVELFVRLLPPTHSRSRVCSGGGCNDGGFGSVPLGCSVQSTGDWTAHYKAGTDPTPGCIGAAYQVVCSGTGANHPLKGTTSTAASTGAAFGCCCCCFFCCPLCALSPLLAAAAAAAASAAAPSIASVPLPSGSCLPSCHCICSGLLRCNGLPRRLDGDERGIRLLVRRRLQRDDCCHLIRSVLLRQLRRSELPIRLDGHRRADRGLHMRCRLQRNDRRDVLERLQSKRMDWTSGNVWGLCCTRGSARQWRRL